jgi:hypothetical protein
MAGSDNRGIRTARNTSAAAVAAIAAWSSYSHMVHVALAYGEPPQVAYALPFSVDGMLIVATIVMVDDKHRTGRVRPMARLAFTAGVIASIAANIAAAHPTTGARIVDAWPAIALLLVVEMLARPPAPEVPAEHDLSPQRHEPSLAPATPRQVPHLTQVPPRAGVPPTAQVPPGEEVPLAQQAPPPGEVPPGGEVPLCTHVPASAQVPRPWRVPPGPQAPISGQEEPTQVPLREEVPVPPHTPRGIEVPLRNGMQPAAQVPPPEEVPPASQVPLPVHVPHDEEPRTEAVPPGRLAPGLDRPAATAVVLPVGPERSRARSVETDRCDASVGSVPRTESPNGDSGRRPTTVTRRLARQIIDAEPDLPRTEVAARLGVSPRRLRAVLADPA